MEVSGQHHTHATLYLQKNLLTRRLSGLQSQSGQFEEKEHLLSLIGFKAQVIQSIA